MRIARLSGVATGVVCVLAGLARTAAEEPSFPESCRSFLKSKKWKLTAVCGSLDWKPGGAVRQVAVSPDGKLAITGGHEGLVQLFELPTGKFLRTLVSDCGWVDFLAFRPGGNEALVVDGGKGRVVEVTTGKVVRSFGPEKASVRCAALTLDGKKLVLAGSAGRTGSLWVLDVETGKRLAEHSTEEPAELALLDDGKRVAVGSSKADVRLVDLESGKATHTIAGPAKSYVASLDASPDGKRLAVGYGDGSVKLLGSEDGSELKALKAHRGRVEAIRFMADGERLVTGSDDYSFKVWDLESGAPLASFAGPSFDAIALMPGDGKKVLTGSVHRGIMLWDLEKKAAVAPVSGHAMEITSVRHLPDGKRAVASSADYTLKLWDLEKRSDRDLVTARYGMGPVCLSRDGSTAVVHTHEHGVQVVDVATASVKATLPSSKDARVLRFRGDSTTKLVGLVGSKGLKEWDLETKAEPTTLMEYDGKVNVNGVLDDLGRWALFTSLRDRQQYVLPWDLTAGKALAELRVDDSPRGMTISRDGTRALIGTSKGDVLVWNLETRAVEKTLQGHSRWTTAVLLTPDRKTAISASRDMTIRFFGLESGGETDKIDLSSSGDHALVLDLSEDGRSLLVGTHRGVVLRFQRGKS